MSELSICREDDGDMSFEVYLSTGNLVSVSVHEDGTLNWAGGFDNKFSHGNMPPSPLGLLLFQLIERAADSAPATHIGKKPSPSCEHVWHADGDYDRCDLCHGQKKREPL